MDILKQLESYRLIPVIAIDKAEDAGPLADALVEGGLPVAEVTFRTAAAEAAIKTMAKRGGLVLGAGTVLNVDTVKKAVDAGATYIVSPGFNPKVVSYCVQNKIPITPGIATPTEIEFAIDHGLSVVKFFPAEAIGGIKTLKAVAAPYGMMRFIPTGGITDKNVGDYLSFKPVVACGGSWMVAKELLSAGNWNEVTRLTRDAVAAAKGVKR